MRYTFIHHEGSTKASTRNKCSAAAEMGNRLATIDMGRKLGSRAPFYGGELGLHLAQCGLDRGRILIHPAVWPQQTWTQNWGLCPLFEEGEMGPHLAQCGLGRGLPPYQVAS